MRDPVGWGADTDPAADSDELNAKQQANRMASSAASSALERQKQCRVLTFVACNNCRQKKRSVGGVSVLSPSVKRHDLDSSGYRLGAVRGLLGPTDESIDDEICNGLNEFFSFFIAD
jgi:hypothetical protein